MNDYDDSISCHDMIMHVSYCPSSKLKKLDFDCDLLRYRTIYIFAFGTAKLYRICVNKEGA